MYSQRLELYYFQKKRKEKGFDFEEMVAQVKRSTEGREDTPDSDCEKYFSDA